MKSKKSDYSNDVASKGFTLLEVLIVLGAVAIISGIAISVINPLELLRAANDTKRLSDIEGINNAINLYRGTFSSEDLTASTTTVFVSLPDTDNALPNDCDEYTLPILPGGWSYSCALSDDYQKIDGTGWLPVDFLKLRDSSGTTPFNTLAIDPTNTESRYYSFTTNGVDWELTLSLEAVKNEEVQIEDGGNDDTLYEKGSSLAVYPIVGYKLAQTWPDLLTVLTNSQVVYAAGVSGQVPYFTGSNTIAGNNNLFWDSGNERLGIGTDAPFYPLDVVGDINFTGQLRTGLVPWSLLTSFPSACSSGQYVSAVGSSLTCGAPEGGLGGSGTPGYIAKFATATTTADSVIYESSGKIGIGTTSPSGILDVVTENTGSGFTQFTRYGGDGFAIALRRANGTSASPTNVLSGERISQITTSAYRNDSTWQNVAVINAYAEQNHTTTGMGTNIRFETVSNDATARTEKMRITANGNVGIGTTSPLTPLHVYGTGGIIRVDRTLTGAGNGAAIIARKSNGDATTPTATLSGDDIGAWVSRGYGATGFTGGGVTIKGIAAETHTDTAAGQHLTFFTNPIGSVSSVERMRITSEGNVGIGTTSPSYPLSVNGTVNSYGGEAGKGYFVLGDPLDPSKYVGMWRGAQNSVSAGNSLNLQAYDGGIQFMVGPTTFGNATERMRITSTGNVGIGTTSPGSWLLSLDRADGVNQMIRVNSNAPQAQMVFAQGGTDRANIFVSSSSEFMLGTTVGGPTIFRSNGTERARIHSTGGLQLAYLASPPVTCNASNLGTLYVDSTNPPSLCFCGGVTPSWLVVSGGGSCN